ncbi:MAG: hypothetical protein PHS64_00060 [Candidatus Omnitrophica bacterium]|nr:hypothetical protein [Candidatus Omnitrophota bacterium]MDD5774317.1 hypothetical protein [Candidatus Omnitrophota bacterium]
MVKRMTLWQGALACAVLAIVCMCGFAVAKEKLMLKYLPVDHDIEMVSKSYKPNPLVLTESHSSLAVHKLIDDKQQCDQCRRWDEANASMCPPCCLYEANNKTLVHCRSTEDGACPGLQNNPMPFNTSCIDCSDSFTRDCGSCPEPCAKFPDPVPDCQKGGCPGTAAPVVNPPQSCKKVPNQDIWYCTADNLSPRQGCPSNNANVTSCSYSQATAYVTPPGGLPKITDPDRATLCPIPTQDCYKYEATPDFKNCIATCTAAAHQWEIVKYANNKGRLGPGVCGEYGNCTAGFNRHCNATICDEKVNSGCLDNYTTGKCGPIELNYREFVLGGMAEFFRDIEDNFLYKFVARNGEKYMAGWQVLCNVVKGDDTYNFYTMVKVVDAQNNKVMYNSTVHQKALGHTFYINAQTGFSQVDQKLEPGRTYIVKLYYFLPTNDQNTHLQVEVSDLQMILYRTKN